jgi:SAM-dependent methyltransferase
VRPVPPTGHWHDDYERGRPGWPLDAVELAGLPPTAAVLELGPGTGKLTRLLVSSFERVIAVEPDPEMRAMLAAACPAADGRHGRAEEIPLPAGSVDGVFAAEAFHWFDGDRALAEIARVLRPGGPLVLLWNVPAGPTEPSIAAAEELLLEHAPPRHELGHDPLDLNADRFSSGEWQAAFAGAPFEELREARIRHVQVLDRDAFVAFFESMAWLGELPEERRTTLVGRLRGLLEAGEYRRPWETRVHWTQSRR